MSCFLTSVVVYCFVTITIIKMVFVLSCLDSIMSVSLTQENFINMYLIAAFAVRQKKLCH